MAKYTKKERKSIKKIILAWKVLAYTGMTKEEYIKHIDGRIGKAKADCYLCDEWDNDNYDDLRDCDQCPLAYKDSDGDIQNCYIKSSFFQQFNDASKNLAYLSQIKLLHKKATRKACARLIVKQMEEALERGKPEFKLYE